MKQLNLEQRCPLCNGPLTAYKVRIQHSDATKSKRTDLVCVKCARFVRAQT